MFTLHAPTTRSPLRVVRHAGKVAFHYAGGIPLYRYLNRGLLPILNAHRFTEAFRPRLEARCAYLRKHYHMVSMGQVSTWLCAGKPLPPHSVAQTVDDGYRDFYLHGYPVFAAYAIPVTVFLVSRFIDRRHWMWWDMVTYLFGRTPRSEVVVELPSGQALRFTLGSIEQRDSAAAHLITALTRFPYPSVLDAVATLPGLLRVELPIEPPGEYAPLSWDEVREMMAHGIGFGAHTMTHALLPDLQDREMVRAELEGSKRRLEEELGVEVAHFAYPNGDHNPATREAVQRAGFMTASTMDPGINAIGADPFTLRRLSAGADAPERSFRERAAGFWPSGLSAH
jgi:peptidoglycan/xylan/chitin deacetylase (PgdA/CDA1 family)